MKKRLFATDKYFVSGFWILFFFMIWLQVLPQTESILESLLFCTALVAGIIFPTNYLSKKLLLKAMHTKSIKLFVFQFVLCSIYIGLVFTSLLYFFFYLERNDVFAPSSYFDMSDIPLYATCILFSSGVFVNLCMCGLRFLLEYVKSQKILLEYQLRTLQHQVTPHFMFNVLNHIHVLMQTDVELASSLLIKYSEILRYQLYNGEKRLITLKEEIQFLNDFIAVEELRWDDKLVVTSKWNIENEDLEIPSLLFITFVENAFKHVSKSGLEKGYINSMLEQTEKRIQFDIINSKSMIEVKKKRPGLGLKNVKERLELLYPNSHELRIEETDSVFHIQLILTL